MRRGRSQSSIYPLFTLSGDVAGSLTDMCASVTSKSPKSVTKLCYTDRRRGTTEGAGPVTNHSTDLPRLSWAAVCARRLERHALSAPAKDARPADIVAVMCGAHAQVLSAAELSIGLRLD